MRFCPCPGPLVAALLCSDPPGTMEICQENNEIEPSCSILYKYRCRCSRCERRLYTNRNRLYGVKVMNIGSSEKRRLGKEFFSTCSSRVLPLHIKKKKSLYICIFILQAEDGIRDAH